MLNGCRREVFQRRTLSNRSRCSTGSTMDSDSKSLQPELSDEHWLLIADLFSNKPMGFKGGRPAAQSRACFEGILWVLRSGARWKDMPSRFPSYPTCWRRFAQWSADGLWDLAMQRLLEELDSRGKLNWKEGFADGTFASAKKGAISSARPSEAKAPRSWHWSTAMACQ